MCRHGIRSDDGRFTFKPESRAEGTGYWTRYALLAAAFQQGTAIRLRYVKRTRSEDGSETSASEPRWVILLSPPLTSLEGNHYVKAVDLDRDGPRSFRLDKIVNGSILLATGGEQLPA